MTMNVSRN